MPQPLRSTPFAEYSSMSTFARQPIASSPPGTCSAPSIASIAMVIHLGGTLNVFDAVSMTPPTYNYAFRYAAFDAFRRLCNDGPYDPSIRDHIVPSYAS